MTVPVLAFTEPVGPDDGDLIVLGPSLGTSTILWEDVIPGLSDRYRVVAWDLPGHGASPVARVEFSVADLADAVCRGIREFDSLRVVYAGVSLGGAVGLELMLRHPGFVNAAAIIASGAKLGDPPSWQDRAAKVRSESTSSIIGSSAQRWFAPDSIARIPDLSGRLLHALQACDDESYALCCEALAAYDVRNRLGDIRTRTLAIWGEHDEVAPESNAEEIAHGVSSGRSVMVAGAAHLPPAEQPDTVAEQLRRFFADAERSSH